MFLENTVFNLKAPKDSIYSSTHAPRILIIYGSLREKSFSKMLAEEAGRILTHMGADVKVYNPEGLPMFDNGKSIDHPKVQELRNLSLWSEGQVWSSPELHGNISGVMKTQIDWIPLALDAVRPTGKDISCDGSIRWKSVIQCRQYDASFRAMDENDNNPKPILRSTSFQ